jgi:hypothetical protein
MSTHKHTSLSILWQRPDAVCGYRMSDALALDSFSVIAINRTEGKEDPSICRT